MYNLDSQFHFYSEEGLLIAVFIIVCTLALTLVFQAKLVKSLAPSVLLQLP